MSSCGADSSGRCGSVRPSASPARRWRNSRPGGTPPRRNRWTGRPAVNYPAMRYVASDDCKVKGPGRALLWVIAYHADRDTGECWVGQRRLARESGLARSTVQLALDKLFDDLVLEPVEDARGPRPERYRIAPSLVEGEAFGSGMVEGTASVSGAVEGEVVVGAVIHNPGSSGPTAGPLPGTAEWLVDRSAEVTGPTTSALSSGNGSQGFKQGSSTSREEHVVGDADSTAGAVGVADAREPPPVDPKLLDELERRGLRGNPRPPPKPEQRPRSREEQLAILERIAAEDEAKAKNGQDRKSVV